MNEIIEAGKNVQQTGICQYCGQAVFVEAPEGAPGEYLNELATACCECDEAKRQRKRKERMKKAGEWARQYFSQNDGQIQAVCCAIKAVFENNFDYVTIKAGKKSYKIDLDSDGMIRIKTTYRDSNEETF